VIKDNKKLFAQLKELYGIDKQCLVACEECGELIQAISKMRRNPYAPSVRDRLIDEISDVSIMIEQIAFLFDISDEEIEAQKEHKILRQYSRVANIQEGYDKEISNV